MTKINWTGDLDSALQTARNEGKFVLLDFFSPT